MAKRKTKVKSKLLTLLGDFEGIKKKFYEKVNHEGFESEIAQFWWDKISGQASYSFALSHCLPKWSKIKTNNNEIKTVEEIIEDDSIKSLLTYNFKKKEYEIDIIDKKMDSGELELYKIVADSGEEIECSAGERFLTKDGWKRLDKLKEEDEIYIYGE